MSSTPAERALREDAWLSERLGKAAFRLTPGAEPAAVIAALSRPAFVQATVAADSERELAMLRDAGMNVVSEAVTFAGRESGSGHASPSGVAVRLGDPDRDAVVGEIAERSFRYSRFHLDPEIEQEVAARIKRDWTMNALAGERGNEFLVAEAGGETIGFLAILDRHDAGERIVDLIAVDPVAQRSGAAAALMARMLEESGGALVRAGTQTANEPAIRFYERLGFAVVSRAYDLHVHLF